MTAIVLPVKPGSVVMAAPGSGKTYLSRANELFADSDTLLRAHFHTKQLGPIWQARLTDPTLQAIFDSIFNGVLAAGQVLLVNRPWARPGAIGPDYHLAYPYDIYERHLTQVGRHDMLRLPPSTLWDIYKFYEAEPATIWLSEGQMLSSTLTVRVE